MGIRAHIGAGVILSNVRLDKKNVRAALLSDDPKPRLVETGLAKFGAILGDGCEVGCNSVLNPGTILGAACAVPPLSRVRGSYPAGTKLG
jgi:acetyltransferase-like isoleucine patch superfamily enzyme